MDTLHEDIRLSNKYLLEQEMFQTKCIENNKSHLIPFTYSVNLTVLKTISEIVPKLFFFSTFIFYVTYVNIFKIHNYFEHLECINSVVVSLLRILVICDV
jgi:hypothetical protein